MRDQQDRHWSALPLKSGHHSVHVSPWSQHSPPWCGKSVTDDATSFGSPVTDTASDLTAIQWSSWVFSATWRGRRDHVAALGRAAAPALMNASMKAGRPDVAEGRFAPEAHAVLTDRRPARPGPSYLHEGHADMTDERPRAVDPSQVHVRQSEIRDDFTAGPGRVVHAGHEHVDPPR
jgi:hypothetical protein